MHLVGLIYEISVHNLVEKQVWRNVLPFGIAKWKYISHYFTSFNGLDINSLVIKIPCYQS